MTPLRPWPALLALLPAVAAAEPTVGLDDEPTPRTAQPSPQQGAPEPPASATARWVRDELGRPFRVGFDPGSRWLLGWGYAPRWTPGTLTVDAAVIETGVLYRHLAEEPAGEGAWKLYHEVLLSRVQVLPAPSTLSTTLYTGRFLHWTRDGQLVLPTSPPHSVPFPLNIGFELAVGQVEYADRLHGFGAEIGVARAEILLDLWRQRELGSYAEIGLGPAYELWLQQGGSWDEAWGDDPAADLPGEGETEAIESEHVVAPFTRLSFALHHESADGHHAVDARVAGGYALTASGDSTARLRARASYELILLAINDLPLSAVTAIDYRYELLPRPAGPSHELGATAAIRLAVPVTP